MDGHSAGLGHLQAALAVRMDGEGEGDYLVPHMYHQHNLFNHALKTRVWGFLLAPQASQADAERWRLSCDVLSSRASASSGQVEALRKAACALALVEVQCTPLDSPPPSSSFSSSSFSLVHAP